MAKLVQLCFAFHLIFILVLREAVYSAPVPARKGKFYLELIPQDSGPTLDNEISRNVPTPADEYNSPIYYIRLPPIPYTYIPGLGYVSQSSAGPPSLVNVPISFMSNGKPITVYQWSGAYSPPPPKKPTSPKPPISDSKIHRLKGKYNFNGKPNDIYLLKDSYNSLYSDPLQNIYP